MDPKAIDISNEISKDVRKLNGNGDFQSDECIELLKQADIVVTNPPFSLFREYVKVLVDHNKDFLILGNMNAITYRIVLQNFKDNKIRFGFTNGAKTFILPNGDKKAVQNKWFTTLPVSKHNEDLILFRKYTQELYPRYDNYDAINVDKTCDIPADYDGAMGVPISFLDKYDPKQFEIIDGFNRYSFLTGPTEQTQGKYLSKINGIPKYARIIIKKKK